MFNAIDMHKNSSDGSYILKWGFTGPLLCKMGTFEAKRGPFITFDIEKQSPAKNYLIFRGKVQHTF